CALVVFASCLCEQSTSRITTPPVAIRARRSGPSGLDDIQAGGGLAAARALSLVRSSLNAVVVLDEDLVIVDFNPAAERAFGLSAADAIGEPLTVLLPDRFHE